MQISFREDRGGAKRCPRSCGVWLPRTRTVPQGSLGYIINAIVLSRAKEPPVSSLYNAVDNTPKYAATEYPG